MIRVAAIALKAVHVSMPNGVFQLDALIVALGNYLAVSGKNRADRDAAFLETFPGLVQRKLHECMVFRLRFSDHDVFHKDR